MIGGAVQVAGGAGRLALSGGGRGRWTARCCRLGDGSPVADAVEAIGVCTRAASLVFGAPAGVVVGVGADGGGLLCDQHESALAYA